MNEIDLYKFVDLNGRIGELKQKPSIMNNKIVVILKMIKNYIKINDEVTNCRTINIICDNHEPIYLKMIKVFNENNLNNRQAMELLGLEQWIINN